MPTPPAAPSAVPTAPGAPVLPRPAPVDPSREYLAGGSTGYGYFTGAHVLSQAIDDITRAFGPELYEFMLLDAAVAGSLQKIATGVLSGRVNLVPTVKPVPGRPRTAEMDQAEAIAENNRQNLARLERPIEDVLKEMLYALAFGNLIAEVVEEPEPIEGKRALRKLSPKPWWGWRFGVDAAGNTLGVIPTQGALGLAALGNAAGDVAAIVDPSATVLGVGPLLDPRHFAILSWDARGGSPQGNSILRPCYPWWNEKRQAIPDYRKFIRRLASPKPIAKVKNPGQQVPELDATGVPTGRFESVMAATQRVMQGWDNDSAVVLPAGDDGIDVEWYNAENDGQTFTLFYEFCDRMILRAILGSARAVMEAEHGSKADSEVAQDGEGSLYRYIGAWLGRWLRRVLFNLNADNFGPDAARAFTPEVLIGEAEHQDQAGLLSAFASVGYQADLSQFPAMDAMANLPERVVREDEGGDGEGEGNEGDAEGEPASARDQGKGKGKSAAADGPAPAKSKTGRG